MVTVITRIDISKHNDISFSFSPVVSLVYWVTHMYPLCLTVSNTVNCPTSPRVMSKARRQCSRWTWHWPLQPRSQSALASGSSSMTLGLTSGGLLLHFPDGQDECTHAAQAYHQDPGGSTDLPQSLHSINQGSYLSFCCQSQAA